MRRTSKTITLTNGKTHTLTLDFNAAADFEEITGESFFAAPHTATTFRARVWAMLRQTNESITLKEVGALLGPGGTDFETLMAAIHELSSDPTSDSGSGGGSGRAGKSSASGTSKRSRSGTSD